jgi:hypothetical protein
LSTPAKLVSPPSSFKVKNLLIKMEQLNSVIYRLNKEFKLGSYSENGAVISSVIHGNELKCKGAVNKHEVILQRQDDGAWAFQVKTEFTPHDTAQ